ncbi:DUF808 family protein [Halomonas sp. GT]|uniref:DUF808 family protein n=1 Tax=Halomonas sp. GT TaxID=1971364 RepID=UPI001E3553FC|nr:DUF808 family protein [Halomonas sp. GT]
MTIKNCRGIVSADFEVKEATPNPLCALLPAPVIHGGSIHSHRRLKGLLDDIAALAKLTAASLDDVSAAAGRATAEAAGVVVDDTAVTPQYLQGGTEERELAVVK